MGGAVVSPATARLGRATVMSNIAIAFCVLGALFTLYVVAATWQSKDARSHMRSDTRPLRSRAVSVDRRLSQRWRAQQRSKNVT